MRSVWICAQRCGQQLSSYRRGRRLAAVDGQRQLPDLIAALVMAIAGSRRLAKSSGKRGWNWRMIITL
jgi:hypothetical protein